MSFSVITKTSIKNQITLPKKMIDAMSVNSTTPLSLTFKNNQIIIESVESQINGFVGFLKDKVDPKMLGISDEKMSELIDTAKDAVFTEKHKVL